MIQKSKIAFSILCVLLLPVFAAACAPASTPAPTAVLPTPTALQMPTTAPAIAAPATSAPAAPPSNAAGTELAGATLYALSCASCHGADAKGSTFEMDGQKIDVPSLAWDELSTTFQTQPDRGDLSTQVGLAITKGQDETGADLNAMMPRWSSLSQAQVDIIVQYLQTAETAAGGAPNLADGAGSLQGEQLYAAACAACHGADGAGKTFEMDGNKIETPSLHWSDLSGMYSTNPSRGSVSDQLALAITKGEDEAGDQMNAMMPHWSTLSQAQVDSLVQYLQTAFP